MLQAMEVSERAMTRHTTCTSIHGIIDCPNRKRTRRADTPCRGQHGRWIIMACLLSGVVCVTWAADNIPVIELESRVIAVGIPGIAGVRQVGSFHPSGAIPSNPQFAATTRPGQILAPDAVLVTSTSNFGAPLGVPSQSAGAILSITTTGHSPLLIPTDFASRDGQAATLGGAVRLLTAQSPAFLNRINNPRALTALQPAVANPRYISINNAFGRPWFASVPEGTDGLGTSTVIDPTGRPLAHPPSATAGGVFAGTETNRLQQEAPGALTHGAVGTAFLGPSPDASGPAVFAVVQTDA